MTDRLISEIKIGARHRKTFGDIEGLARNIEAIGLLHPVVIDKDGNLIAGERRIKALLLLGRVKVPVNIVDLAEIVHGEFAENTEREDFTLTEAVAIKRSIEPLLKAEAKERMIAAHASPAKLAQQSKGRARDKVAKRTGKKRTSLAKAEKLVEALEAEPDNPKIAKLVETMDDTGRVNGPFKRLMVMRQAEAIRAEPPPLPGRGPYRVIVADPPWPYDIDSDAPQERATYDYPQMSIAEICDIDVDSIAHDDSILWLWTTNFHMRAAFKVLDAWGFEDKTILTWSKDRQGRGHWLLGQTEHCIMATRGKPTVTLTNQTTLLHAPVREHSQKPEEFYALVEKLCPAPRYAELFSRQPRDKWDGHGDEAQKPAGEWQLSPADVAATESNLGGG
ncbi:MT-A70 family methyltransferase [Bradyrhizobium sp.]|uniref:MT-A70 family methyltransferase n=1 Tax=Bradyrhizobium sp. TaxID=376 RepID=UPI003BAFCD6E